MTRRILYTPEEIREWIDEKGGSPVIIRADSSENEEHLDILFDLEIKDAEEISWEEFFDKLERENLALSYDDEDDTKDFSFIDKDDEASSPTEVEPPIDELPDSGDEEVLRENLYPSEPPPPESDPVS